jgi:hypothetical protein
MGLAIQLSSELEQLDLESFDGSEAIISQECAHWIAGKILAADVRDQADLLFAWNARLSTGTRKAMITGANRGVTTVRDVNDALKAVHSELASKTTAQAGEAGALDLRIEQSAEAREAADGITNCLKEISTGRVSPERFVVEDVVSWIAITMISPAIAWRAFYGAAQRANAGAQVLRGAPLSWQQKLEELRIALELDLHDGK